MRLRSLRTKIHSLEFAYDIRLNDDSARDFARSPTVRLRSSVTTLLCRKPTLTYVYNRLSFYRRKPPFGGLARSRNFQSLIHHDV